MNKDERAHAFDAAARMIKAVAHPARIEIIDLLGRAPKLSVNELKEKLGIKQSMTSQHLAQLRHAGVLGCSKEANTRYYYVLNKNVFKLLNCIRNCS